MDLVARHEMGDRNGIEFASAGTHGFRNREMDPVMAGALPNDVSADGFSQLPADGRDGAGGRPGADR